MKISVIVPVYNAEKYLTACLDSILSQTYQDFEIILINDGSKDISGQICDEYSKNDERIRVVHQENHGVSHARNVGLSMVTGDAVSFIDSDDTLEPDMYELLVRTMQEHNADIAHCGFHRIEADRKVPIYNTGKLMVQDSTQALECLISGEHFTGSLWSKLIRAELISDVRFRVDLKINEDVLFNFELFRKANITVFVDLAKYNYYVRENASACFTTPGDKKRSDSLSVNRYIYEQLKDHFLADCAAERYLHGLLAEYRFCKQPKQRRNVANEIKKVYGACSNVRRNIRISVLLIRACPIVYLLVYAVFDRIRKPKWEI